VTLTCPPSPGECLGGSSGGAGLVAGPSPLLNAGTIKVDSNSGTGASVNGAITNTGTMTFEKTASLGGQVTNNGFITVGNGAVVTNAGSSCGGTEPFVKNDTGGTISGVGTGVLSVINFEQGEGITEDVVVPCGSLKYTGNGASNVKATGGFTLTGTMQSNQSLTVSAEGAPNVNAVLGGNFTNHGEITLTCTAACGANGGAGFNVNDKDFINAGTFTVATESGTGVNISANSEGSITNTGTMNFNQTVAALGGPVTNQGAINIADTKSVTSGGGCGGGPVKNDTGGSINATGTGALFVGNYEQGDGTTTGANPVQLYGGCLKYTGAGASKVLVTAGFDLSGEMQAGQSLTVTNNSPNTNLRLVSPFASGGSITLTCPSSPCSGPGFNGNGNLFTNAGTFTVDAAATEGSVNLDGSSGGIANAPTGTFQLNGNTQFNSSSPFSNQGTLQIAAGVNNTPSFTNAGTIVLDQSATNPFLNTGTLTNAGTITTSGASANTSSINGTVDQTGASAQVVVPTGTKLSLSNPLLLKAGKLSGGGTLQGSVNNSGGTVAPGASPGTLTLSGDYTQGAGGKLEIEIAGTGAGQFDKLAIGGSATLDGALALQPVGGYPASSAVGDSVDVLSYIGARTGEFGTTTTTPSLACPKQLTVAYVDPGKKVAATVASTGASCGTGAGIDSGSGGGTQQPPPSPADTILRNKPKKTIKAKKSKVKVKFVFSSNVAGATFKCKLDKQAYSPCGSPKTYMVKKGKHSFAVRATGPGGTDPSPATFSFKVVKKKTKGK
jgi:hypothetical protein